MLREKKKKRLAEFVKESFVYRLLATIYTDTMLTEM